MGLDTYCKILGRKCLANGIGYRTITYRFQLGCVESCLIVNPGILLECGYHVGLFEDVLLSKVPRIGSLGGHSVRFPGASKSKRKRKLEDNDIMIMGTSNERTVNKGEGSHSKHQKW